MFDQGHFGVLRHLLAARADCNIATTDGTTCLHIAVDKGHLEAVQPS